MIFKRYGKPINFTNTWLLVFTINYFIGAGLFMAPGRVYHFLKLHVFWVLPLCFILAFIILLCFKQIAETSFVNKSIYKHTKDLSQGFLGCQLELFRFINLCVILSIQVLTIPTSFVNQSDIFLNPFVKGFTVILVLVGIIIFYRVLTNAYKKITPAIDYFILITLCLIIITGIWYIRADHFILSSTSTAITVEQFSNGFLLLFFNFLGLEDITMNSKAKLLPPGNTFKMIIKALLSITILYTLLFITTIGIKGESIPLFNNNVATVVKSYAGKAAEILILIITLITVFGATLITINAGHQSFVFIKKEYFTTKVKKDSFLSTGISKQIILIALIGIFFVVAAIIVTRNNSLGIDSSQLLIMVSTILRIIQYIVLCLIIIKVTVKKVAPILLIILLTPIIIVISGYLLFHTSLVVFYYILFLLCLPPMYYCIHRYIRVK